METVTPNVVSVRLKCSVINFVDVYKNKGPLSGIHSGLFHSGTGKKINTLEILKDDLATKPHIGQSMMDGGEKIKYLYQYLGNKKYLELLKNVFS